MLPKAYAHSLHVLGSERIGTTICFWEAIRFTQMMSPLRYFHKLSELSEFITSPGHIEFLPSARVIRGGRRTFDSHGERGRFLENISGNPFSSNGKDNHLLRFGDYAAMHCLAWNNHLWPASFSGLSPDETSSLDNARLGAQSIKAADGQCADIYDFR